MVGFSFTSQFYVFDCSTSNAIISSTLHVFVQILVNVSNTLFQKLYTYTHTGSEWGGHHHILSGRQLLNFIAFSCLYKLLIFVHLQHVISSPHRTTFPSLLFICLIATSSLLCKDFKLHIASVEYALVRDFIQNLFSEEKNTWFREQSSTIQCYAPWLSWQWVEHYRR